MPSPTGDFVATPAATWADTVLSTPDSSVAYRVTGGGIEIHNTTSDLYKQGTLTVVRTTNRKQVSRNVFNGSYLQTPNEYSILQHTGSKVRYVGSTPISDFDIYQLPPATLEDALLQGALQWNAADGVMSVSVVDNKHNAFTSHAPASYAIDSNMFSNVSIDNNAADGTLTPQVLTALVSQPYYGTFAATSAGQDTVTCFPYAQQSQHFTPRDLTAVYLTGLSLQTTFTLTTRYQVELKPRVFDSSYSITVPMLRAPPDYSLKAELIGAHLLHELPPGVPAGMNPSGEAWADIISTLGNVAGMVGPIFGPIGATVGAAANGVAKVASNAIKNKAQKKQAQNGNKQAGKAGVQPVSLKKK